MASGVGRKDRPLTPDEISGVMAEGLESLSLGGKRVLVITPDSTRTAPVAQCIENFYELLSGRVEAIDFVIALGTHPIMPAEAVARLVGSPVTGGPTRFEMEKYPGSYVFNHRWDEPDTFVQIGTLSRQEVEELSGGQLSLDVPVKINRLVMEYDHLIVCGPVFPHEVVGFSGGNKYFFPGIGGWEIIDFTHWLGALLTIMEIIGVKETPVREAIDRAAAMIPRPRSAFTLVMHGTEPYGLFFGTPEEAFGAAADLSADLDIVYVENPFRLVVSVMPEMYDDLWTAAKGTYKVEPAVADGGEVIIYAPHITEVSYTHGKLIDQVGYHVKDYFLEQWDRFKDVPWMILAHSTHVKGAGTYDPATGEHPRINVTLATGIPEERCKRINLGYRSPESVDLDALKGREDEGILVIPRAGEMLYRLKGTRIGE
jgi:nickel-dependent lactate racemase